MQGDLLALMVYMIVGSVTPGPNNLMLLQGSLQSGIRACKNHALGISSGVAVMGLLSYWGVTQIFLAVPLTLTALKVFGSLYLVWLVVGIWSKGIVPSDAAMKSAQENAKWQLPLNYWQALAFQYINPKAWTNTLLLPAICIITGDNPAIDNIPLYLLYFVLNLSCISVWVFGGNALRRLLHKPRLMKYVSWLIMLSTLYCAVAMWF